MPIVKSLITHIKEIAESEIGRFGIILVIIFVFFFRFEISYNEMDVVPYAYSFYNKDWLAADWYLNQSIPYRYLFNYLAGYMVESLGFIQAIFIGRIITYLFMSYGIYSLISTLRSSNSDIFFWLAFVIHFSFFSYGMGAGEWMIGGFDTKVFAYAFVLLSLNALFTEKYRKGWFFGGLALSFHVLIGLYHMICLVPFLLSNTKERLAKSISYYLLGGLFGLYSIAFYLLNYENTLSSKGFETYVNISVPHHTIPSVFPTSTWVYLIIFTCINFAFLRFVNQAHVRQVATYVLASVVCFLFGLLVFYITGPSHYLRYYFFRHADILLPFLTLLMIAGYADKKIKNRSIALVSIAFLAIILLSIPKIKRRLATYTHQKSVIHFRHSKDLEMEKWIKKHTAIDEVFITNPDDKYFYLNYERPVFVLTRQSPQSGVELSEWYRRLKLLNGNVELASKDAVEDAYENLNYSALELISKEYPEVSYMLMSKPSDLHLPICHQTDKMILYRLNSDECF